MMEQSYEMRQMERVAEVSDFLDTLSADEKRRAFTQAVTTMNNVDVSFLSAFTAVKQCWVD
jgi:hypothetical protein